MQKIKEFIKKNDNLIMIVIILLAMFSPSMYSYFIPYDNVWNFGNIYKLYLGQIIYKEANIIITPIYFWMSQIIFELFGANFFVYKIYTLIMVAALYFLFYIILKKLKIDKLFAIVCTILIMFLTQNTFAPSAANYNILALIFIEIAFLINISAKENNWKKILEGILVTIIFLTYQKAGAGYFLTLMIIELVNKNKLKIKLKNIAITTFSMLCSLGIFLIYEYLTNNIWDFINMCILGIANFGKNNTKSEIYIYFFIVFIILMIGFTFIVYKNLGKETKELIKKIISFFIGNCLICVPILNKYHIQLASVFIIILGIYEFYYCTKDIFTDKKLRNFFKIVCIISTIIFIGENIIKSIIYIPYFETNKEKYNSIYYGAIIEPELKENIDTINKYIKEQREKGKKVIIFSSYAMLYNENYYSKNGMFDLPNKGNFGKNGEEELKKKIDDITNEIILVQNKDRSKYEIYQFADSTREYIKQTMKKNGEIENYDIYEK